MTDKGDITCEARREEYRWILPASVSEETQNEEGARHLGLLIHSVSREAP